MKQNHQPNCCEVWIFYRSTINTAVRYLVLISTVQIRSTNDTCMKLLPDIIKMKIHSSCEIEDFVETHLASCV